MRSLLALLPVFAMASCDTGDAKTSSAPGAGGNTVASSVRTATCVETCSAAADCGTPGDPLYDPSHFACQSGRCQWLGCKAASECSAEAHGGNFLCQATAGGPPSCVPACQKPADCVPPGNTTTLDDANHFACTAGACVWLGCQSTTECVAATSTTKVACQQPAGSPTRTCVPTCATANDCGSPNGGVLGNSGHYACVAQQCQWLGCKSSAECVQALQSSNYVCQ
jgi:hypothetical protein